MSVPTPIVPVQLPSLVALGLALYIKRDDLIHPLIIGNKLRKWWRHFEVIQRLGYNAVLTFGGRFSNHLLAVAQILGITTTCVVRGTDVLGDSVVLDECRDRGVLPPERTKMHKLAKMKSKMGSVTNDSDLSPTPFLFLTPFLFS